MASPGRTVILITGANSGIGYDTSSALAAASPYHHVVMACRDVAKGQKALAELSACESQPRGTLSLVQLNVSDDESIAAAVRTIESDFGVLDVLVNNAGVTSRSANLHTQLRETFEANTFGPALVTEAFVPLLKKSKNPRIVNVSSRLGSVNLRADPADTYYKVQGDAYRMSKAALDMLSVCQHVNFQSWGCKVWAYCPGYVITNLTGEGEREKRRQNGAESSETSAQGILKIVTGQRDGDIGRFVGRRGEAYPW